MKSCTFLKMGHVESKGRSLEDPMLVTMGFVILIPLLNAKPHNLESSGERLQGHHGCLVKNNDCFLTCIQFNPFPNKPWFLRVCSISLLKTLCEKEKLLVTSNFSFYHSVFYPLTELTTIFITFEIVVVKLSEFGRV